MNGIDGHESRQCCIMNCPQPATESESAHTEHWRLILHYCDEHARELRKGTPLGPVGIDPSRIEVQSKGTQELPTTTAVPAIGPQ
jgi:hypothetical protein